MNEITVTEPLIFIIGGSGVVVVEAAKFAAAAMGRNAYQRTRRYKHGTYWLGLLSLFLVAGFVTAVSVGSDTVKLLTALQIGINAPALITAWATASERDAVVKARGPSLGITPVDSGDRADSRSLLQRILEDQAW